MISLRDRVRSCLGKEVRSVLQDVFGVYGTNPQAPGRSLKQQLRRMAERPFVRVACVTVLPTSSADGQYVDQQLSLDSANQVYERSCGVWVYCSGSAVIRTDDFGPQAMFEQADCGTGGLWEWLGLASRHDVTAEERQLFGLGRDLGADIVCYFLPDGSTHRGSSGCSAHPPGLPGFWVSMAINNQWTFAHELGHIVGGLGHVGQPNNLMNVSTSIGPGDERPFLNSHQCDWFPFVGGVVHSPHIERCAGSD